MIRATMVLLRVVAVLLVLCIAVWGSLAIYFRAPLPEALRIVVAGFFAVCLAYAIWSIGRGRFRRAAAPLLLCPLVFGWWATLAPSNTRNWSPEGARTVTGEVSGDRLVLTNVRNFDWRSETEFTPRWETRSYDLSRLERTDLFASYWDGETIAHILISFGFSDGQHVVWSAELRRSENQVYSTIEGLFKQSELVFIAGDERDLIRLRTNVRGEDTRLYPLKLEPEAQHRLLLGYVEAANRLASEPRWYNTITTNCTTVVFGLARAVKPDVPYDWRILLSGHLPEYVYELGALDARWTFAEWRARAGISPSARAADTLPSRDFSRAIRMFPDGRTPAVAPF